MSIANLNRWNMTPTQFATLTIQVSFYIANTRLTKMCDQLESIGNSDNS